MVACYAYRFVVCGAVASDDDVDVQRVISVQVKQGDVAGVISWVQLKGASDVACVGCGVCAESAVLGIGLLFVGAK